MSFLVEPFRAPYMQRALVELVLLAVLAGVVGVHVVLRRLAFIGDALTHTVFPGVVIAHLLGASVALGALLFAALSAVAVTFLARARRVGDDAALAIVLTTFFSVGVVLISRSGGYTRDLNALLFGRLLAVETRQIVETAAVATAVLLVLAALHKELLLRAFDPDSAIAIGFNTARLDLVLNLALGLVVVAAVRAVGTALVIALIVTPAATARLFSQRVGAMMAIAGAIGVAGGALGLILSYQASVRQGLRLAPGATVVVVLTVAFAIGRLAQAKR